MVSPQQSESGSPEDALDEALFCSCFPFCGIEFYDLSAEDYYSNEKHFQEISPRQI